MTLTVGDLKRKMKHLPEDTIVNIERVEDVYFDKHNWKTERIIWRKDKNGIPIETTDYFSAASSTKTKDNQLLILAHY